MHFCCILCHRWRQEACLLVQDAHNLAWKLAAVIKGRADGKLLQSYGAERRPIAQANADLSVANFQDAIKIPQALGLDPRAANFLHSTISSIPAALVPAGAYCHVPSGPLLPCILADCCNVHWTLLF